MKFYCKDSVTVSTIFEQFANQILFSACSTSFGNSTGHLHSELRFHVLRTRHFADYIFALGADQT